MENNGKSVVTAVVDHLGATRDAIAVRRVFGEAYEVDGVTVIPVAQARGGGGGGGGEGRPEGAEGSGFGTGYGIDVRPVGVYEVSDGHAQWKPAVDVTRLARGGQALAALITVCLTAIAWKRASS